MLPVKRVHSKLSVFTLFSVALFAVSPARAADLYHQQTSYVPPAPVYTPPPNTWAGFYVGVNGGYAWDGGGDSSHLSNGDSISRAQPEGGFGGGQIGYNFQMGHLVFGVETDFQGADISDSASSTSAAGLGAQSSANVDWFGTVRGRLGYGFDRTLIYFTGGFAYGDVSQSEQLSNGVDLKSSGTQTGYVLGGGVEYKINPAWSLKGEYQYIDLGSSNLSGFDATGAPVEANHGTTNLQTVRLGLNYHFNSGPDPLK
jgi:outer membrane immunogenic protein